MSGFFLALCEAFSAGRIRRRAEEMRVLSEIILLSGYQQDLLIHIASCGCFGDAGSMTDQAAVLAKNTTLFDRCVTNAAQDGCSVSTVMRTPEEAHLS